MKFHGHNSPSKLISGDTRYDYSKLMDFLIKNIEDSTDFKNDFSEFVKENLYFNQMNQHYVYNLVSFSETHGKNITVPLNQVIDILEESPFNLNNHILDIDCKNKFDICNTTFETEEVDDIIYLTNLRFIIFIETLEDKNDDDFNLFCTIDINLKEKFVSYKFNTLVFDLCEKYQKVIDDIDNMLYNKSYPLHKLNIVKESHNLSSVRQMIQNIFIDLSQQAEDIISNNLPENIDETIYDFIDNLGIEPEQKYRDQIISVVYQDIGSKFSIRDFKDGWVFRFLFREGDNTRASSRSNNNQDHIYSTQIYWNLKELMFDKKGTEFIEAGFLWNINPTADDIDKGSVSVRIEQNNNDIRLNFYAKPHNLINRKEKEEIVLQNIRSGFSTG